jgi:hypothetical protein
VTEYYYGAAQLGATVLTGCVGGGSEITRNKHNPRTAGNTWERLRAIKTHAAQVRLETASLGTLLDFLPQGGASNLPYPCKAVSSGSDILLWSLQQDDILPIPKAGSTHERTTIPKYFAHLSRIAWPGPGEPALSTLIVHPLSADGTATYWTRAAAAAPSLPGIDDDWTLDGLTIGGSAMEDISDFSLDIEAPITPRYKAPNHVYPTIISAIASDVVRASMSFKSMNTALLRTYGDGFSGSAAVSVVATFRNYAQASTRGGSTKTITMSATVEATASDSGRSDSVQVLCEAIKSTTDANHPLTW